MRHLSSRGYLVLLTIAESYRMESESQHLLRWSILAQQTCPLYLTSRYVKRSEKAAKSLAGARKRAIRKAAQRNTVSGVNGYADARTNTH